MDVLIDLVLKAFFTANRLWSLTFLLKVQTEGEKQNTSLKQVITKLKSKFTLILD